MRFLAYRLYIGLLGLGIFWGLGMVSGNEFAKTGVLMTVTVFGVAGVVFLWKRNTDFLSRLSIAIYLLFFFDAAVKGFLRSYFGLRPNHSIVLEAVFNTDTSETVEFFIHNWRPLSQAAAVFAVVALLAIVAERTLRARERGAPVVRMGRGAKVTVMTMLFLFVALHFNPTMAKEDPLLFWPLRYAAYRTQIAELAAMQNEIQRSMAQRSEWQVKYRGEQKRTVVWVIGESINRANMSIYRYPRPTTPMLDALRADLLVFGDVVSPDSSTMASLQKMLTPAEIGHPNEWTKKPDVLMLAKEAGYKTFWLSNQAINDGWLGLVSGRADERKFINLGTGRGENNYDGNLLADVDKALQDPAPRKLIVVHLLGAHPTYDMRYPKEFSHFDEMQDAVSDTLEKQGRPIWIRYQRNKYDNAILYNDYVVGNLIRKTAQHTSGDKAALIYTSDHGQEVGHHRDHAGHSPIDDSGYEIPMIVWEKAAHPLSPQARAGLEHRPYQTDQLEHTVLGLLKINTIYYDANRDILSDRFMARERTVNGRPYVYGGQDG